MGVVLGIIGVTTTVVQSPAQTPHGASSTPTPAAKTVDITSTNTNVDNIKNAKKAAESLAQIKSSASNSKPLPSTTAKIAPTSPAKIQTKQTSVNPILKPETKPPTKTVLPITAGAVTNAETSSLAISDPFSTFPLKLGPVTPTLPPPNWEKVNQKVREATVNIICTSKYGGSFEPLSGSGVIIDPRGIILTNAHVAQYFLIENYRVKDFLTCIARTGSPATPKYTLKLLYISKQWVQKNYKNITNQKPMGTGENDYALLQVTGSTNPDIKLPTTFPAIAFEDNEDDIRPNDSILLASYPAGFLGGIAIQRDLYMVSTIINLGKLYTFKGGTLDAFSLGGSPVAQHGSSGGGAVNSEGKLLGIIVTSTDATDTSSRDLDAISVAHINRSLSNETGFTLETFLASSVTAFGKIFEEEILPNHKKLFAEELDYKNR